MFFFFFFVYEMFQNVKLPEYKKILVFMHAEFQFFYKHLFSKLLLFH